jgi:hypothetical protein
LPQPLGSSHEHGRRYGANCGGKWCFHILTLSCSPFV